MSSTTFRSAVKVGPKPKSQGTVVLSQYATGLSATATSTATATDMVLPQGAYVLDVVVLSGGASGTSPTFDVGIEGNADYFAAGQPTDSVGSALTDGNTGTGFGTTITAEETVYIQAGGTPTGGTVDLELRYSIDPTAAKDASFF